MAYSKSPVYYIPWSAFRDWKVNGGGGSEGVYRGLRPYIGARNGEKVDNWRMKIKNMRQAGSVFISDKYYQYRTLPFLGTYTGRDDRLPEPPHSNQTINTYSGSWSYIPDSININHLSTDAGLAENLALKKIYSRLRAQEEAFSGFPFLAELKETLSMIIRPASALRDGISKHVEHMRKNHQRWLRGVPTRKRLTKFRKIAAGSWLEFSFGWAPTVSDVVSGAEALAKIHAEMEENGGRRSVYHRLQGSGRSMNYMNLGTSKAWSGTWHELTLTETWHTTRTVKYVVGWLREEKLVLAGSPQHFLSTFGLDQWRNLVLGAWEIIPYSWLADYFSNVGDLLECWATPTQGIQWIVRTERVHTVRRTWGQHTGFNNVPKRTSIQFSASNGICNNARTTVTRSTPTTLGYPSLMLETPFESFSKTTNMLAVWTQVSDRIFKSFRKP